MITLKQGMRGEDVKILQEALNSKGFNCGKADGIFGAKTGKAVRECQRVAKLTQDGLAGKKTCTYLGILEKIEAAQKIDDITIACPDIKQGANPHGPKVYGPDKSYTTFKDGGCCPTSITCVVRAYYDSNTAVETIGSLCIKGGYRIKGSGTSGSAINYCLKKYGGSAHSFSATKDNIVKQLKAGHLVILCIKKGFQNLYNGSGHYVVIYGVKNNNFLIRDVGSSAARRQWCPCSSLPTGVKAAYYCEK